MAFVVVTGLPGAGKTTVGRALAAALDVPFLDKDDFLDDLLDQ
jgi:shikimate kinase / 3-dehydroquinate synthase